MLSSSSARPGSRLKSAIGEKGAPSFLKSRESLHVKIRNEDAEFPRLLDLLKPPQVVGWVNPGILNIRREGTHRLIIIEKIVADQRTDETAEFPDGIARPSNGLEIRREQVLLHFVADGTSGNSSSRLSSDISWGNARPK